MSIGAISDYATRNLIYFCGLVGWRKIEAPNAPEQAADPNTAKAVSDGLIGMRKGPCSFSAEPVIHNFARSCVTADWCPQTDGPTCPWLDHHESDQRRSWFGRIPSRSSATCGRGGALVVFFGAHISLPWLLCLSFAECLMHRRHFLTQPSCGSHAMPGTILAPLSAFEHAGMPFRIKCAESW